MPVYRCATGDVTTSSTIEADSAQEAAEEYVNEGDYETDHDTTYWITVDVWLETEDEDDPRCESIKIAKHPQLPECVANYTHDWYFDSVQGHGGGARHYTECRWCGTICCDNSWAQDPVDGTQGLTSISYQEPSTNFTPTPFTKYPSTTVRIADGDSVTIDDVMYKVCSDTDELCGWAVFTPDGNRYMHLAAFALIHSFDNALIEEA